MCLTNVQRRVRVVLKLLVRVNLPECCHTLTFRIAHSQHADHSERTEHKYANEWVPLVKEWCGFMRWQFSGTLWIENNEKWEFAIKIYSPFRIHRQTTSYRNDKAKSTLSWWRKKRKKAFNINKTLIIIRVWQKWFQWRIQMWGIFILANLVLITFVLCCDKCRKFMDISRGWGSARKCC